MAQPVVLPRSRARMDGRESDRCPAAGIACGNTWRGLARFISKAHGRWAFGFGQDRESQRGPVQAETVPTAEDPCRAAREKHKKCCLTMAPPGPTSMMKWGPEKRYLKSTLSPLALPGPTFFLTFMGKDESGGKHVSYTERKKVGGPGGTSGTTIDFKWIIPGPTLRARWGQTVEVGPGRNASRAPLRMPLLLMA